MENGYSLQYSRLENSRQSTLVEAQSMGLHRVEQTGATQTHTHTHTISVVFCYAAELTSRLWSRGVGNGNSCTSQKEGSRAPWISQRVPMKMWTSHLSEQRRVDSFSIKGRFSVILRVGLSLFNFFSCWAPRKGSLRRRKQIACSLPLWATFPQG